MRSRRAAAPLTDEATGAAWDPEFNPAGLTELEVASGVVLGQGSGPPLGIDGRSDPLTVLRAQARVLLEHPPCVVAFSGGRDSSALLAVLVDMARREGLEEPLAVTARWDGEAATDENDWQELVIAAVGAKHWEIIRPGTDLDLLGVEATTALTRIGLMWPAPAYALLPIIRKASGGVFVTGEGGDEAFGVWPYGRLWSAARAGKLPRSSDLRALTLGLTPRPVRRWRWQRNLPPYQAWLRPLGFRDVAAGVADDQAGDPLRWDRYQQVNRRRRAVDLTLRTFEGLSSHEGARYAAPFLDERFLGSLAAWGGRLGRGDRSEVMTRLFSTVLPDAVLTRESKASFGGVFWGPSSRAFAEQWDGRGLSDALVNPEALRKAWLAPMPVYGSALPLQAAWMASRRPTGAAAAGRGPLGGSSPP